MIIIIDEASAKLASFYYHGDSFKPQWRNVAGKASMSEELQEKLYVALPVDESINDFQKTTIQESADNTAKANTGNQRIPKAPADCIWIVSNRQQKQIADSLGIASVGEPQCGTRYAVESLAELDIEYLERVRRRYNHIPWDIGETELEYQKAYIENMYGFYEYGMWLVFSKETGKLIGRAGLEHDELGYMIAPELWNQGYATEVCRFIIDYARENTDFEELYCRIDERNTASVRLAKKLGFTNSGYMDDDINASIYRKNIKNNEKH